MVHWWVHTLRSYFFSMGIEHMTHCCNNCLNWSGNYREKQRICPLFLAVLDVYVGAII
jgi:hypothetical protein